MYIGFAFLWKCTKKHKFPNTFMMETNNQENLWPASIKLKLVLSVTLRQKAMAPHSSTLAWKIPWTEKPDGLQSMGSLKVRHDWATLLSLFTFMYWRRKWQPTPVFLPGESQGRGAWWAAIYGVAQSWTQLKQLSSSHSYIHLLIQYCQGYQTYCYSFAWKIEGSKFPWN